MTNQANATNGTAHDDSTAARERRRLERAGYAILAAGSVVLVLSPEGSIEEWNGEAERIYGRARAAVLGHDYFEECLPEEVREAARADFRHALASRPVRGFECQAGEATLAWGLTRIEGSVGVMAVGRDVTEHRRLEAQLRQALKMEAVGRLAGGVAHDFNNVLTVVSGFGELLHAELEGNAPARQLLQEIRKAVERATALTRQLLAFSRKQLLRPRLLRLNDLIGEMERMLRRLIREDIDLATRLAPDLGPVRADPSQIEQVLLNLVVNARDAMPQGGLLTIETRNVELSEEYVRGHLGARRGLAVLLAVSDSGVGMTPEVRARAFEPFFTTKEPGQGTGLGLATVYGVVQASGGHVEVYSEPGRGSTFKVYLPREQPERSTESGTGQETPPGGDETLLLVEDEPQVRALGALALRALGYQVLTAEDGEEALRLSDAHTTALHLLVTDVVLPRLGGPELARRLIACRPGVKVLYLSGYTDDAIVRHGVLEPNVAFLHKPYSTADLAARVRQVLDSPGQSR